MVYLTKALCTADFAWMYGAIMTACFRRYMGKASLLHQPLDFITSNGIPCKRYSRINPIRIPWPCNGSRNAASAAFFIRSKNFVLVRDCCIILEPFFCLYKNRWWTSGGLLTLRWLARAASGSVRLSYFAQNTSSPSICDILVLGMCNIVTLLPPQS